MKKLTQTLTVAFCISAISILGVLIESCQNAYVASDDIIKNESSFINNFKINSYSFFNSEIIAKTSRSEMPENNRQKNFTQIYLDLPADEGLSNNNIRTPNDILNLVKETGTDISFVKDEDHEYVLTVSDDDVSNALKPLILDCKKYLYGKGFSETEIQDMLVENNTDESSLIPFVLALAEEEEFQNSNLTFVSTNLSSIFAFEAHAEIVDWDRAGGCAIHALGFNALAGLAQSRAKHWTKAILRATFKTVASKMCGPVGVAVTVIDFSICYWG